MSAYVTRSIRDQVKPHGSSIERRLPRVVEILTLSGRITMADIHLRRAATWDRRKGRNTLSVGAREERSGNSRRRGGRRFRALDRLSHA